jgi:hypothetical protein
MSKEIELEDIKNLVEECIKNNKIDFLSNLVFVLQNNYKDLATLCTDGNYHEGWSHTKVLDYITYETN